MKRLLPLLAAVLLTFNYSFAQSTRHYELKFDEFHELKVVDGINVTYTCDPDKAGLIEFDADASVASAVIFTPGKGKLTVSIASRDSVYHNIPTVHVYSSFLSDVKNEGDSTVRILKPAPVPKLSAKLVGNGRLVIRDCNATEVKANIISGHGTIMLTGTATAANFLVAGTGDIQADDLKAQEVSAVINGTGAIACYPMKKLSVGGLGTGKVSYRGAPEIKKKLVAKVKVLSIDKPSN